MTQIPSKTFRFGPIALTATLTTNVLNPPSLTGGVGTNAGLKRSITLHHISVINKTATPRTFSLWIGPSGTNAAGNEAIAQGVTVAAFGREEYYGEFRILPHEFLVGGASAATALTITGEGVTEDYQGFVPITRTYDSGTAQTENQPPGAQQVVITTFGPGGGGARWNGTPNGENPYGGGGGGYSQKTVLLSGTGSWTYTVGVGGDGALSHGAGNGGGTTTVSGTSASMTANGGAGGTEVGGGGTGGTASGGDTNTTGGDSTTTTGGNCPNGGVGGSSSEPGNAPGGGGGAGVNGNGGNGANGRVVFAYT